MRTRKCHITALLCAFVLLGTFTTAWAAEGPSVTTVRAQQWTGDVITNGEYTSFLNEHGRAGILLTYHGTVYMPLRSAGEWLGCTTSWNPQTKTVTFQSGGTPYFRPYQDSEIPPLSEEEAQLWDDAYFKGAEIQLCSDIAVSMDGKPLNLVNASGTSVPLLLYRQEVYVPMRSIGTLCGLNVFWRWNGNPQSMGDILIYATPSDTEAEEIRTYVAEGLRLCGELRELLEPALSGTDTSDAWFLAQCNLLYAKMDEFKQLPIPTASCTLEAVRLMERGIHTEIKLTLEGYEIQTRSGQFSFAARREREPRTLTYLVEWLDIVEDSFTGLQTLLPEIWAEV